MSSINDNQIEEMKNLYQSGIGTPKIAEIVGCSKKTVQTKLRETGIFKGRKQFSKIELDLMEEMFLQGKPLTKIAGYFNVGEKLIRKILTNSKIYSTGEKTWTNEMRQRAIYLYRGKKKISEISSELGVSFSTISAMLKSEKLWEFKGVKKYEYDDTYFCKINNEQKAYWLGFIAADGNVGFNNHKACLHIGIHKDDFSLLEEFRKNISSNAPIKFKENDNTVNIDVYSREFVSNLILNNILPAKTFILSWKDVTQNVPDDLLVHFMRGYFDGDGSWAGQKRTKFALACASYDFLHGYQSELARACDLNLTKIGRRNNCCFLEYGGRFQLYKIKSFLYDGSTLFLKRKKEKIERVLR